MSNKFALSTCIAFLAFNLSLVAQNAALQKAETLLATERVDSAIYYFEIALGQMPSDAQLRAKLANIYRLTNRPEKAVDLFESLSKSPEAGFLTNYWYAYVLKMSGEYEKSRTILMTIKSYSEVVGDPGMVSNIEQAINSCDFAIQNKSKVPVYNVTNEQAANSAMADFSPVFHGNSVYYASKRIIQTPSGYSDPNNDFMYVAQRKNSRTLDNAKTVHDPNSADFLFFQTNFAPFSLSKDGKTVFTSSNQFGAGIRHPNIADLKTASPFEMGFTENISSLNNLNNNNLRHFPHYANKSGFPHLSADGKTLYFAARGLPISYGGYDIYVSYFENGNWSEPINLGSNINTAGDEISPFIDEEGVLYFASEGHLGFGGFDVFRAEQIAGTWKDIRNLGIGVNSSQDDLYFIYDYPNEVGYFASNRKGGLGDYDIYSAAKMGDVSMMPKVLETEIEHIVVNGKATPNNGSNNPLISNIDKINTDKPKADTNPPKNTTTTITTTTTTDNRIPCAENAYIGVLIDAGSKKRLESVRVYVTNLKTQEMKKCETSKYGEYAVLLDPETAYEIRCSRQGYENILFEVHTGDGLKRSLLGEHAMVSAATNTNLTEDMLAANGLAGRGINTGVKEEFVRGPSTNSALPNKGYQIQIGVFKTLDEPTQKEFAQFANILTEPYKGGEASIYRLGVFADEAHAKEVLAKIQRKKGFEKAYLKTLEIDSRTSAERMNNEVVLVYPKKATQKTDNKAGTGKIDDPELNIEIDNKPGTEGRGLPTPPQNEIIVKETPRKSYADNPMLGEVTARGVSDKPLEFKIQIGAYKDPNKANFPDLSSVGSLEKRLNKDNGLTYFFIIGFTTLDDARVAKTKAEQKGITSPFIVPFKNGKKVSISEAVNN